ncbi:MAG: ABC transporter ATP-binding protein [Actinobacteria bacterium]|nr:ABC transporter ATP-binding protein [Actinomycetota bacterium]
MADQTPVPDHVVEIRDFTLDFPHLYGRIGLVRGVDLDIARGECVGLVGESGSGKTLLGLSIVGLQPPSATVSGSLRVCGRDVLKQGEKAWRSMRGRQVAMIYQDALVSLNPGLRVRKQLEQALRHEPSRTPEELLEAVQIRDVARCLGSYPHELSGGQRQRVLIALAISARPEIIVADEPTTALDVTVQAQVMTLLDDLRREFGFGLLFISHDLGLVSTVADRVAVMYAGEIVEVGATSRVLGEPRHPYTRGLLDSSWSLQAGAERLSQIPGVVPAPSDFLDACRFSPRCSRADDLCRTERPRAESGAACHHPVQSVPLTKVSR